MEKTEIFHIQLKNIKGNGKIVSPSLFQIFVLSNSLRCGRIKFEKERYLVKESSVIEIEISREGNSFHPVEAYIVSYSPTTKKGIFSPINSFVLFDSGKNRQSIPFIAYEVCLNNI